MTTMIHKLKNLTNLMQLASFALVGVLASLTHAGVFHLMFEQADWSQVPANILGFLVAFAVSYFGQFRWTFKEEAKGVKSQGKAFLKFFKTALAGLLLNLVWSTLVIDILHMHHYFYLALLMFVTPGVIFLLNKFWVFKS